MSITHTLRRAAPAVALLLTAASGRAATLHVPADHATVQAAVNEASSGDTVLVAPGRYKELIELKNGITLLAAGDSTVLVAPGGADRLVDERHVIIPEGADSTTVIEGFVFEADGTGGCAILVNDALVDRRDADAPLRGPTIRHNTFIGYGWGVNLVSSDALITDNEIRDGTAFGVQVRGCSPRLFRNDIHNLAGTGVAISGRESRPVIGGSPENANRIYANTYAIENASRNDIDATWNDWGWDIAVQMNDRGYPADILAIVDGNDVGKTHRGRGNVDYRHWATGDGPADADGGGGGNSGSRLPFAPLVGALALVVVLVVVARMRSRAG